jgi:hypothetical protein
MRLGQPLADIENARGLNRQNLPEDEEEQQSGNNKKSEENPSSPIIPTRPAVVLISVLINTTVECCQLCRARCAKPIE